MNIAFISQALPYLPSRGGFRLYGGNLIRVLSRRHRIDLISLLIDDDADHLAWASEYCATVRTIPTRRVNLARKAANFFSAALLGTPLHHRAELNTVLRDGLTRNGWDVLHVEGAFAGGLVRHDLPVAKVLSVHDSWTLRCQEMLQCSQSLREKLYYKALSYQEPLYERHVYPRFERCIVVAERDVKAVRQTVPAASVGLIPYGTDTDYFRPVPIAKQEATLVFHSHLGYAPNVGAALEFADDILPLIRHHVPRVVFHLVGAGPSPQILELAQRPGIRLSANLADLRPAVCEANVYVSAIRYGTGLKSKILEALAMRMPIVCYPGSAVGIDCVSGQHLLVADTPEEFAAHVVNLLRDPARAEQLAASGRQLVEQHYSWESRARAYEDLYQEVIAERTTRE